MPRRFHFDFTSIPLSLGTHVRAVMCGHTSVSASSQRGRGPTQESKAATRTWQKSNQGGPGQGHDPNPKQTLAVLNRSASSIGPSTTCPEFMGFMKGHEPGAGGTQKSAPLYMLYVFRVFCTSHGQFSPPQKCLAFWSKSLAHDSQI